MAYTKKPSKKTVKLLNLEPNEIDYKNVDILRNFIDNTGKILSFKQTGFKAKVVRKIKRAIKRSRAVGLMPFVGSLPYSGPKKEFKDRDSRDYRDNRRERSN
ncbi:MAG: 30S ribosomal protein S18 [Candidatus Caenarcaniphilales bacterium]|nr:30S ribosomal protein S18 [Candidatus Caenarcaniphilales bacterium]